MRAAFTSITLGLCTALFFAGACSSSTTHPPTATSGGSPIGTGGGGGGSSEGGADEAGSSDTDGGNCLTSTVPFDIDTDTGLGGTNQIAGTVSFSTTVSSGHNVVLTVTNTMNASITYADTFSFTAMKDSFTFRLRNLPDATFVLQAQADVIASSGVNDSGDLDGYFGGTTVTPIHTRADSTALTLPPCHGQTEFGIGPK